MLTKIYTSIWFIVAVAAGVVFLTGNFTMFTAVVFGFIIFGLVFMGMMVVLPASIAHPAPNVSPKEFQVAKQPISIVNWVRAFKAELLSSDGVEIRKPRYH
jgi:hypothetical protein